MDYELLKQELIRHEGVEHRVYKDSLGYKTAGIGHLLVGDECDMPVGTPVSEEQVDAWFEEDIERSIGVACRWCLCFDALDELRQRIMVNLAFNLGNKLGDFKRTLGAVEDGDYERAAEYLQQSRWYKQVGRRGKEICHAMRHGEWPF